jgi:hypothetical protein
MLTKINRRVLENKYKQAVRMVKKIEGTAATFSKEDIVWLAILMKIRRPIKPKKLPYYILELSRRVYLLSYFWI